MAREVAVHSLLFWCAATCQRLPLLDLSGFGGRLLVIVLEEPSLHRLHHLVMGLGVGVGVGVGGRGRGRGGVRVKG